MWPIQAGWFYLFVLTVPVVRSFMVEDTAAMCIDGVTVGVVPYFTRHDGIVGGYLFWACAVAAPNKQATTNVILQKMFLMI